MVFELLFCENTKKVEEGRYVFICSISFSDFDFVFCLFVL